MNKSTIILSAVLCTCFMFSNNAKAEELEELSIRAGSLGVGAEIGFVVVPTIVVRGIVQSYDYDFSKNIDGIQYDGTLGLKSYGVQADFHPPLSSFYLTAGVFKNDNQINFTAIPSGTYFIGNNTYTGAQVGVLTNHTEFNEYALYGGLGLEMQLGPLATVVEGGVYYQGDPKVSFTASGPISTNPAFLNDLNTEIANAENELEKARFWPAVTVMGRLKF